ncbi:MAG: MlaD family protein [Candidatus Cloacimonetes bacterium]|nr:MlaD family protein [Candidatus Cloacimonadota bacterium]MCF7813919.1 MlaD family protein [Candidatus Cloacimonadota bacterium]MCF7868516.1 MlaD family protein [Candidatus Cloacimonadota bacterium]MCF7884031.1 MlaD family protein [Candidatus Cloacimonadota bacterium]
MKFYKNKKANDFKVGLFTLIGLAILVLCYIWFMEILENRNYSHLKVAFDNAGNTEIGSPVTINGVKKGRVEGIEVKQDGVILLLKVQLDFTLLEGTEFYILESSLMGDIQIEIVPGNQAAELDLNNVHSGKRQMGLTRLVANLGEIVVGLQSIMEKVYGEDNLIEDFQAVMDTTKNIMHKVSASFDKNSSQFEQLISNANNFSSKLNKLIDENGEDVSDTIGKTSLLISEIDKTMQNMQKITVDLQSISQKMSNENSSFNRLISEEELYNNLLKATSHMDSLILDIKKNPKKYFEIKVF